MEFFRELNDLAFNTGRFYQKEETGFLHLSYSLPEDETAYSIPLYENFLFALVLLRTKTQEGILEGKVLLEKLLSFQTLSGNFPIHIHEYPQCPDRLLSLQLLPVFYWVLAHFKHILGAELTGRLIEAANKMMLFTGHTLSEKEASEPLMFKYGAVLSAFGELLQDKNLCSDGAQWVDKLRQEDAIYWFVPKSLSEILIGLQMLKDRNLLERLRAFWHDSLARPVVPAIQQFQIKNSSEVTLFHLFMGALSKTAIPKNLPRHYQYLQAALIQPEECSVEVKPPFQEGELDGLKWASSQGPTHAFSLIEKNTKLSWPEKGFHPFYFIWPKATGVQSFALQGGNIDQMAYEIKDQKIELSLTLSSPVDPEDRAASREIAFFTEDDTDILFEVDGIRANTFRLGEKLTLHHAKMNLSLTFFSETGEGMFQGHITKGNRPSQINKNHAERHTAFDWKIFLRTIQRPHPCQLRVVIEYEPKFL